MEGIAFQKTNTISRHYMAKKKSGYIHTYIEFGLLIMKRMAREGNLATKAPQVKVNPRGKVIGYNPCPRESKRSNETPRKKTE